MPSRAEIVTFDDSPPPPGADPFVPGTGRSGRIEITESDPDWPRRYAEFAARIREVLGWRALQVEHVGSTSVPGLPAKPIIDIDLVVADPGREQDYVPALETAGFTLVIREPWWYGHRSLQANEPSLCNVHVFGFDSPETIRHRIFRDWLRGNPGDRDRYAAIKRQAAAAANAQGEHVMQYNARKEQVIREIYQRAFAAAGLLLPVVPLAVAEAVEEAAEHAAVAGEGGSGRGRGGALVRDGLVVVGAISGTNPTSIPSCITWASSPAVPSVSHSASRPPGSGTRMPYSWSPLPARSR
jgi:GrpB-like predicted nucleotidyltransferase (UPF0157 family)